MEMKKEEQMIYVKDLLFAALYRWKTIVAVAVLLALVLGGPQVVSAIRGGTGIVEPDPVAVEQYQSEKAALEKQVEYLQHTVDNRQLYLENSLLMQLDPYDHYEARVIAYAGTTIDGNLSGVYLSQTLLSAYRSVLNEQAFLKQLAQALEINQQYAAELISVGSSETMAYTLEVTVKCDTEERAEKLAEIVAAHLEASQKSVATAVTAHSLSVLEKTAAAKIDPALGQTQQETMEDLNAVLTAQDEANADLEKLVEPVAQQLSKKAALKKAVILAVLGAVAGVFVTACVIWVLHITGSKVYSARTLNNRTGVKIIGCVNAAPRKNPVDRMLRAWEGRNMQEDLQLLATDIRCRAQGAGKLLVTGGVKAEALVSALQTQLPGVEIATGDITDSAEALTALGGCDAVVLVEQCGVSRYSAVARRIEIIQDYGKQLLGCVVLDG